MYLRRGSRSAPRGCTTTTSVTRQRNRTVLILVGLRTAAGNLDRVQLPRHRPGRRPAPGTRASLDLHVYGPHAQRPLAQWAGYRPAGPTGNPRRSSALVARPAWAPGADHVRRMLESSGATRHRIRAPAQSPWPPAPAAPQRPMPISCRHGARSRPSWFQKCRPPSAHLLELPRPPPRVLARGPPWFGRFEIAWNVAKKKGADTRADGAPLVGRLVVVARRDADASAAEAESLPHCRAIKGRDRRPSGTIELVNGPPWPPLNQAAASVRPLLRHFFRRLRQQPRSYVGRCANAPRTAWPGRVPAFFQQGSRTSL